MSFAIRLCFLGPLSDHLNAIKERLKGIATTKLNMRRYKNKEYAQNQVDNCFQGPKSYLRKIFGNPAVEERNGLLQLVYSIDKELLSELYFLSGKIIFTDDFTLFRGKK